MIAAKDGIALDAPLLATLVDLDVLEAGPGERRARPERAHRLTTKR